MGHTNNYIIKGGDEGKQRLRLLSEIMEPYSKSLIETSVNLKGKRFLDVGSGGGYVSIMASRMVGHDGEVTAIDFDEEIIRLASEDAGRLNIDNVNYLAMDAYDMDFQNHFDLAYARFLLSHLEKPEIVFKNMVASVKKGGVIIIEDIDFSGHFCYPHSEAFFKYVDYFSRAALNNGHNPCVGQELLSMFKSDLRLKDIYFDVIQPVFDKGEGKWMALITMDKIKDAVIRQNIADLNTINWLLTELRQFTEDEHSVISLPRIFRVTGVKT